MSSFNLTFSLHIYSTSHIFIKFNFPKWRLDLEFCLQPYAGLGDKENNSEAVPAGGRASSDNQDVVLRVRRTQSFIETDERLVYFFHALDVNY